MNKYIIQLLQSHVVENMGILINDSIIPTM